VDASDLIVNPTPTSSDGNAITLSEDDNDLTPFDTDEFQLQTYNGTIYDLTTAGLQWVQDLNGNTVYFNTPGKIYETDAQGRPCAA